MAANVATHNNPKAHLAACGISMGYNVSQIWNSGYQLSLAKAMGPGYMTAEQINSYRQERIKHTVLISVVSIGLILSSIPALVDNK